MQLEQLLFRFVPAAEAHKLLLYGGVKRGLLSQAERLTEELRAECCRAHSHVNLVPPTSNTPSGKSSSFLYRHSFCPLLPCSCS
jgi:hypothetical protein